MNLANSSGRSEGSGNKTTSSGGCVTTTRATDQLTGANHISTLTSDPGGRLRSARRLLNLVAAGRGLELSDRCVAVWYRCTVQGFLLRPIQ